MWPALLPMLVAGSPARGDDCPAPRTGERVRVVHVNDGDTLKLADGRRLRLIGIDTPEIRHDGRPSQPLARKARAALQELLDRHGRRLELQPGKQPRDHYGRVLAHAFLDDGSNVAAVLLERGLATALVVPPNTRGLDCYRAAETAARSAGRGLWALPGYRVRPAATLDPDSRGFHIVRGVIREIREARHSTWLDLEGPLVVRVDHDDRGNFGPGFPDDLRDRTVEVRGRVKPDRNGLRINVRHPAALQGPGAVAAGPVQRQSWWRRLFRIERW